jgi:hypothetical protein
VNVSLAKEFHHSLQPFGGSGKGNQPTHWSIQSVDGMQENSSRLFVFFCDILSAIVRQSFVFGFVSLD